MCEALAECYLKQRKQHKAIQLYKEALSLLSLCKVTPSHPSCVQVLSVAGSEQHVFCFQDDTDQLRDGLVERLTAALQQNVSVSLQVCSSQLCPHLSHNRSIDWSLLLLIVETVPT